MYKVHCTNEMYPYRYRSFIHFSLVFRGIIEQLRGLDLWWEANVVLTFKINPLDKGYRYIIKIVMCNNKRLSNWNFLNDLRSEQRVEKYLLELPINLRLGVAVFYLSVSFCSFLPSLKILVILLLLSLQTIIITIHMCNYSYTII